MRRVRRGRGFSYRDERGRPIKSPEVLARIRGLAVPPAWEDVWLCPDPLGHLQATGVDAAGRRQYLYHPRWRERRDREKFDRMLMFAEMLPRLRRRLVRVLDDGDDPTRDRVLAAAVRLLDVGMFIRRRQVIEDPATIDLITALKRRRGGPAELLAYRDGRRWRDLRSDDINDYLKEQLGEEFSAKDFRTWNATVMAAVTLASDGREATSKSARKRKINESVRAVAELLGNTSAVARRSYIDPRVFDRYLSGWTIAAALERLGDLDVGDDRVRTRVERAVVDRLVENTDSSGLERAEAA